MTEETTALAEPAAKKDEAVRPRQVDKSTPEKIDAKFTEWVERLFEGEERCTKIEVFYTVGKGASRKRGDSFTSFAFRADMPKPEGAALVDLANEIVGRMQDEVEESHVEMTFQCEASHPRRGGVFERKSKTCTPKDTRVGFVGFDEDGQPSDPFGRDMVRRHAELSFQNSQYKDEQASRMMIEMLRLFAEENRTIRAERSSLFAENMSLARQKNEAENNALDREMVREERRFIIEAKKKGVNLLAGFAPGFLKAIVGGDPAEAPGGRTPESMTIEAVLSKDGSIPPGDLRNKIFGVWSDDGKCMTPGILGEGQVKVLVDVMNERTSPDALDRLITAGSPDQLTQEQYTAILAALGGNLDAIAPIAKMLQDRHEANTKKAKAAVSN